MTDTRDFPEGLLADANPRPGSVSAHEAESMNDLLRSFQRDLVLWRERYAGRPDLEMLRLCLLALEREEIVVVAYGENTLNRRFSALQMSGAVRELIRRALLWTWKDEEMHAIYLRGALSRLGRPLVNARALLHRAAGSVGGWVVSTQQHLGWSEAPLARAGATLMTWAGSLTGRVPAPVRRHLSLRSFRDFCLYNVDAERTAWLCWSRMADLALQVPELSAGQVDDFRRVAADEERHRQIFDILAGALDENDRLREGETEDTVAGRIETVGEAFLPRRRRPGRYGRNPIGRGSPVFLVRGGSEADRIPLFRSLLGTAGLASLVRARARQLAKDVTALRVAVKPDFRRGRRHRDGIDDPQLVEELALFLRELGAGDVAVVKGGGSDRLPPGRPVPEVGRRPELLSPQYRLVDCREEQVAHVYRRGLARRTIGRTWKEADLRISFGTLRRRASFDPPAVANLEGIGGRTDDLSGRDRQARPETALMMIADEFPADFSLVDCREKPLRAVRRTAARPQPWRLYASADALALDRVIARQLGIRDLRRCRILREAEQWFGDFEPDARLVGAGADESFRPPDEAAR